MDRPTWPNVLRLQLNCDLAEVPSAARAVRQFLTQQGCVEEEVLDCELVLVEACNNAIEHAEEPGRQKGVLLEVLLEPHLIELRITDHTPGFDWPDQPVLPDAENERGRGLYLIHALMNEVRYFRSAGENLLLLRQNRFPYAYHPLLQTEPR